MLVRLGLHPIGFFTHTTRENGGGDLESIPEITESTELDRRSGFTRIAKNGYEQTVTPRASTMVARSAPQNHPTAPCWREKNARVLFRAKSEPPRVPSWRKGALAPLRAVGTTRTRSHPRRRTAGCSRVDFIQSTYA